MCYIKIMMWEHICQLCEGRNRGPNKEIKIFEDEFHIPWHFFLYCLFTTSANDSRYTCFLELILAEKLGVEGKRAVQMFFVQTHCATRRMRLPFCFAPIGVVEHYRQGGKDFHHRWQTHLAIWLKKSFNTSRLQRTVSNTVKAIHKHS